jgi:hypothetical protein
LLPLYECRHSSCSSVLTHFTSTVPPRSDELSSVGQGRDEMPGLVPRTHDPQR